MVYPKVMAISLLPPASQREQHPPSYNPKLKEPYQWEGGARYYILPPNRTGKKWWGALIGLGDILQCYFEMYRLLARIYSWAKGASYADDIDSVIIMKGIRKSIEDVFRNRPPKKEDLK